MMNYTCNSCKIVFWINKGLALYPCLSPVNRVLGRMGMDRFVCRHVSVRLCVPPHKWTVPKERGGEQALFCSVHQAGLEAETGNYDVFLSCFRAKWLFLQQEELGKVWCFCRMEISNKQRWQLEREGGDGRWQHLGLHLFEKSLSMQIYMVL